MNRYSDFFQQSKNCKKFTSNFRIYQGGKFSTKKRQTDYVKGDKGVVHLATNVHEVCYFTLFDTVKTLLGCDEIGELWYRRPGLSLFNGRKKIENDKDVEQLMATKDRHGYVNVYVIDGATNYKEKEICENEGPTLGSINEVENPTSTLPHIAATSSPKTTSKKRPPKLPVIRSKNTSTPFTTQDKGKKTAVESGDSSEDDESDESADPDVILSEGDFDDGDNEDDDLFAENVDTAVLDSVDKDLREISAPVEGDDGGEDDDYVIELEEVDLISEDEELDSVHGSDDEQESYPNFNPEEDFQRPIELTLGLRFPNNIIFRKALRYHAIENGYDYYLLHNGSKRVSTYCRNRCECPWLKGKTKFGKCECGSKNKCKFKVHCKKVKDEETFQIMSLNLSHTCSWTDHNQKCSSLYLAEKYLE